MADRDEEAAVQRLGEQIGFGRIMQLCEQIWDKKQPGGSLSVGPCTAFLVPCCHEHDQMLGSQCDWCCGSGRVTERVRAVMKAVYGR